MATKVVILGSGFGAIYTYRSLHRLLHNRSADLALSIVSRDNYFLFSPMLHEVATGGLNRHNIVQSVRQIVGCCLSSFLEQTVTGIDLEKRLVTTTTETLAYDYLAIALGTEANFLGVPGAAKYAFPLKTIHDAAAMRNKLLHLLERAVNEPDAAEQKRLLHWVVVGGGATGVELAAEAIELAESFSRAVPSLPLASLSIEVHQAAPTLFPQFSTKLQRAALQTLQRKGVRIRFNSRIACVTERSIVLDSGQTFSVGVVLWTAGVVAPRLSFTPQSVVTAHGRIATSPTLNLARFPEVYVVGDILKYPGVPQTAQAAVAAATIAGENIAAAISGQSPTKQFVFRQQGILVSLGQWQAVGIIGKTFIRGPVAWWIWRTVYLFMLVGIKNRVRVVIDWTLNIFYTRDIAEI